VEQDFVYFLVQDEPQRRHPHSPTQLVAELELPTQDAQAMTLIPWTSTARHAD